MIIPATLPLTGGRWVPFILDIELEGFHFDVGDDVTMHIRLYPDAPGVPLVALTPVAAPGQGTSWTNTTVDGVQISTLRIRINESTMEAMPFPSERGDDAVFYYDIHVTRPGDHEKARYFEGPFTIEAGATQ